MCETKADTIDDDYDDGMPAEYDFTKLVRDEVKFTHCRLPIHLN